MVSWQSMIAVLCSMIIHEYAHGWVAYKLGDETAKLQGRLTLNPLKHLDWMGILAMLIFRVGWAKPVPISPDQLRNGENDMILVALAGCVVNLVVAALLVGVLKHVSMSDGLGSFLAALLSYNTMLGIFNLIPIPPLDGSKVIVSLLPRRIQYRIYYYERYGFLLIMLFVMSGLAGKIIFPLMQGYIYFWMKIW